MSLGLCWLHVCVCVSMNLFSLPFLMISVVCAFFCFFFAHTFCPGINYIAVMFVPAATDVGQKFLESGEFQWHLMPVNIFDIFSTYIHTFLFLCFFDFVSSENAIGEPVCISLNFLSVSHVLLFFCWLKNSFG